MIYFFYERGVSATESATPALVARVVYAQHLELLTASGVATSISASPLLARSAFASDVGESQWLSYEKLNDVLAA